MNKNINIISAYQIQWTEYERGWGNRPDGISYHKSKKDADNFLNKHFEMEKGRNGNNVPDEYSAPSEPKLVEISEDIFEQLKLKEVVWIR